MLRTTKKAAKTRKGKQSEGQEEMVNTEWKGESNNGGKDRQRNEILVNSQNRMIEYGVGTRLG